MASETGVSLRGAFLPAVPVPHGADGAPDWAAHERYVAWMARQPVSGVAVWVHTGRGPYLDDGVRERVMRSWREGLGADALIVAGAGARAQVGNDPQAIIDDAVRMAEHAARLGANALLVFPPAVLKGRDDLDAQVLGYHEAIAAVGLPLILFYLYEGGGGLCYGNALLDELMALPGVAGIKSATCDSVVTFQHITRLIATRYPSVTLVTGEDRFLGYSLMRGATACLIGMAAARTAMQRALLDAALDEDWAETVRLTRLCDALAEVTFSEPFEGYIERMLRCLAIDGVIPESAAHDPYGPGVSADEVAAIRACLARLDEEYGRGA
jgi:4-hydroxy-tetrahydrodipicolinate synthase